jgi:hypothetical protein
LDRADASQSNLKALRVRFRASQVARSMKLANLARVRVSSEEIAIWLLINRYLFTFWRLFDWYFEAPGVKGFINPVVLLFYSKGLSQS